MRILTNKFATFIIKWKHFYDFLQQTAEFNWLRKGERERILEIDSVQSQPDCIYHKNDRLSTAHNLAILLRHINEYFVLFVSSLFSIVYCQLTSYERVIQW